jgi:FixJ family two-component response regulator
VEKTIKVHRAHLMKTLKVKSLADLVKLVERLGVMSTWERL